MTTPINSESAMTAAPRPNPPQRFELGHLVDSAAVEEMRAHIRTLTIAPRRLDLHCSNLLAIDPVGAALLWLLCVQLEKDVGTRVRLINFPAFLHHRLRNHPLSNYVFYGDDMFQDPFESPLPSNR